MRIEFKDLTLSMIVCAARILKMEIFRTENFTIPRNLKHVKKMNQLELLLTKLHLIILAYIFFSIFKKEPNISPTETLRHE